MDYPAWLPIDAERRDVLLCFNPTAGTRPQHKRLAAIEAELDRAGYRVHSTSHAAEMAARAKELHQSASLRAAVACGGDGTAALVRNLVPLDVPLFPVPTGNECLLSRYLAQSAKAIAVRETLEQGVIIQLDLGRAAERYFLMMISAGFDAEVARLLHANRRGHVTRFSYLQPILHAIRSYEYPEI